MIKAAQELQTERLRLRQFATSDLDAYAAICADPEVMEFLGGPQSREEAWRQMAYFLGHWTLLGYGLYAVEEIKTGELVGRVGYLKPEGWPGFEVGWTLGRKYWGRGFATEAATAAIKQAFDTLQVDRVISLIAPANAASIRVAERLGETVGGEAEFKGVPVHVYEVTRAAWTAR